MHQDMGSEKIPTLLQVSCNKLDFFKDTLNYVNKNVFKRYIKLITLAFQSFDNIYLFILKVIVFYSNEVFLSNLWKAELIFINLGFRQKTYLFQVFFFLWKLHLKPLNFHLSSLPQVQTTMRIIYFVLLLLSNFLSKFQKQFIF